MTRFDDRWERLTTSHMVVNSCVLRTEHFGELHIFAPMWEVETAARVGRPLALRQAESCPTCWELIDADGMRAAVDAAGGLRHGLYHLTVPAHAVNLEALSAYEPTAEQRNQIRELGEPRRAGRRQPRRRP